MATVNNKTKGINYATPMQGDAKIPLSIMALRLFLKAGNLLFPYKTGSFLDKIFFTPKRIKLDKDQELHYNSGKSSFFEYNTKSIFLYEEGEGPIVLLVHGWGSSSYKFRHIHKRLVREGFKVISFDAPAHGKSTGKQTTGIEFSDIIKELNNRFGGIYAVITHSFGGIGVMLAIEDKLKIDKLITISMPSQIESIMVPFKALLDIPDKSFDIFVKKMENRLSRGYDTLSMVNLDFSIPKSLIIHDKDDQVINFNDGKLFAAKHKESELLLTEGLGHRYILNDENVQSKIVDFLKYSSLI